MRVLWVSHPDSGGPGVFDEGASLLHWAADSGAPPPSDGFDAIVLYGAETNVADAPDWMATELSWLHGHLAAGVPVLGVCFGAQLIAHALGAAVVGSSPPEIGFHPVTLTAAGRADEVLGVLPERFLACQWHRWHCALPADAVPLAYSDVCLQAFRVGNAWGVQFHPEVDRATLEGWIAAEDSPPPGFASLDAAIDRWNVLGRRLFAAFLRSSRPSATP